MRRGRALKLLRELTSYVDGAFGRYLARRPNNDWIRQFEPDLADSLDVFREAFFDSAHCEAHCEARDLIGDLPHDLTRYPERTLLRIFEFASVNGDAELARDLASLDRTIFSSLEHIVTAATSVSRVSCRIAGWAVRGLPLGHRGRYRDEYLGELAELSQSPRPQRRQLLHALRLLARTPGLQYALRISPAETPERAR